MSADTQNTDDEQGEKFDPQSVDWDDFDVDTAIDNTVYSHRNPQILYHLYVREECSRDEVAKRLETSRSTIDKWLRRHRIRKRDHIHGPRFNSDTQPYTKIVVDDENGEWHTFYLHQVVALEIDNLSDVFCEDTEVHHFLCHSGADSLDPDGVAIDIPQNIAVVGESLHKSDAHEKMELDDFWWLEYIEDEDPPERARMTLELDGEDGAGDETDDRTPA